MNSSYFVERGVKYFPHAARLKEECDFNKVSFRTSVERDIHQEWMLTCVGLKEIPNDETSILHYFVSRAYLSQYVVVYSHVKTDTTEEWFVEQFSANVSVVVEGSLKTKEGAEGARPPNLGELLEGVSRTSTAQTGSGFVGEKRVSVPPKNNMMRQ